MYAAEGKNRQFVPSLPTLYLCLCHIWHSIVTFFLLRIRTVVRRAFPTVGFSVEIIQSRRTSLRHVLHDVPETVRG